MNTEDIISMARETGFTVVDHDDPQCWIGAHAADDEALKRFFNLAYEAGAAATKEEMLMAGNDKWLEEARQAAQIENAKVKARLARADLEKQRAVLAAREACAKVAETTAKFSAYAVGESVQDYIAAAIRARNQS